MKTEKNDVRSNGKVVAVAEYPVYDSTQEAIDELGSDKVLEFVNARVRGDEMTRQRQLATAKPSRESLRNKARFRITTEQIIACDGDEQKLAALIEEEADKIEKEMEADRQAQVEAATAAAEDDDDDFDDDEDDD